MELCPVCKTLYALEPQGPITAPVLIVGDTPDYRDLQNRVVFAEALGQMLTSELARVGLPISTVRRMYLWGHSPRKGENDKRKVYTLFEQEAAEWNHWRTRFIQEMENRKAVLVCGTGPVTALLGHCDASAYFGLALDSFLIPASTGVVVAAPSLPAVMTMGIGEFRLALEKMKGLMK